MAKIGVKGFAAGHYKEHRAQRDQSDRAVMKKKINAVKGIDGVKHGRIVANVQPAGNRDGYEPNDHDGAEHRRHFGGPTALRSEQRDQNDDRERRDKVTECRTCKLSPSTAERTEIAGVMTESPRNIEAPITPTMKTKAVRRQGHGSLML